MDGTDASRVSAAAYARFSEIAGGRLSQGVKALTVVAYLHKTILARREHKRLRKASEPQRRRMGAVGLGLYSLRCIEVQDDQGLGDLDQSRRTEGRLGVRCNATVHRNRRVWRRSSSVQFPPVLGESAGTASKNERSGAATWACRGAMRSTRFLGFARVNRG